MCLYEHETISSMAEEEPRRETYRLAQSFPRQTQTTERCRRCCSYAPNRGPIWVSQRMTISLSSSPGSALAGLGRNRITHLRVRRVTKVPVVITIIRAYQKGEER